MNSVQEREIRALSELWVFGSSVFCPLGRKQTKERKNPVSTQEEFSLSSTFSDSIALRKFRLIRPTSSSRNMIPYMVNYVPQGTAEDCAYNTARPLFAKFGLE